MMRERLLNYSSVFAEAFRIQLSSRFYGNAVGRRYNRLGRRLISNAQAARGADWSYSDSAAMELAREGYVRLGDIYDRSQVDRLSAEIEHAMTDPVLSAPANQASERGNAEASRCLPAPLAVLPDLGLLINSRVQNVLRAYFGGEFQWTQTVAYRTRHIADESQEVYSNLWHYDYIHTAYLQLFVYLSPDVTATETGAFRIHSKNSSQEILRKGFLHRRLVTKTARRMLDDPDRIDCIEGTAGTAFLVSNAHCLHRAGVPLPGRHRDVVVFSFIPSAEPFDGEMRPSPFG